jgi:hypothetical protein
VAGGPPACSTTGQARSKLGAGAQPRQHNTAECAIGDPKQPHAWEPADATGVVRHLLATEVGGQDEDGEGATLLEHPERLCYTAHSVVADVEES